MIEHSLTQAIPNHDNALVGLWRFWGCEGGGNVREGNNWYDVKVMHLGSDSLGFYGYFFLIRVLSKIHEY
jgi:hypothetical protein